MSKASELDKVIAGLRLNRAQDDLAEVNAIIDQQMRWRAACEMVIAKAKLMVDGVGPCLKCDRHVPSPCDNDEGFHMDGPWDGFCDTFFRPWRYE